MDAKLKEKFLVLWKKYFNDAELPVTFYYTDEEGHADLVQPGSVSRCVIGALSQVRRGRSSCFNAESIGCFGGKRYLGFMEKLMPDFEYFLSCGIPGKLEGERYKKSPELVREMLKYAPKFKHHPVSSYSRDGTCSKRKTSLRLWCSSRSPMFSPVFSPLRILTGRSRTACLRPCVQAAAQWCNTPILKKMLPAKEAFWGCSMSRHVLLFRRTFLRSLCQ